MKQLTVGALLAVCAVLGLGTPASAHNVLISSDPDKGASLDAGPEQVTLTFDQSIQSGDVNQIAVTGPGGTQWTTGPVEVDRNVATVPVAPLGPAGEYTIGYRVLSSDGHPVSGEIPFTLTKAGSGLPTPTTPEQPDAQPDPDQPDADDAGSSGLPLWVWIAGAVALLAAGLVLALRLGKEPR
ncbi:MAG: copper resistance CopC family protein [Haloechinothrix sp.]